MSGKINTFTMAQSLLFQHASVFSPYWGDAWQSDEGSVYFSNLPDELETLQIKPRFKKGWMGGTCAMEFLFCHKMRHLSVGKIVFKGARGGIFTGKIRGKVGSHLLTALNADAKLKKTLMSIDLDSVSIDLKDNIVECRLTPYGGGMAYLVIPPIRTPVPLPSGQIALLTHVLQVMSGHIAQCEQRSEVMNEYSVSQDILRV